MTLTHAGIILSRDSGVGKHGVEVAFPLEAAVVAERVLALQLNLLLDSASVPALVFGV